jgi:hypothetical protein
MTGRGRVAAEILVADAVDVEHRLPQMWVAVMELRVRVWQARKIASRLRAVGLDREQARWVDSQVTPYVSSLPWARIEALLEAKIIEADPDAAAERARAAELEQFVATGQCNEYGLKTLVAKAHGGDVVFFVATCDRIAQVLLERGDTSPVGVRRAKAIGILADPARALTLLAEHAMGGEGAAAADGHGDGAADENGALISAADLHPADDDSDDAAEGAACASCGASTGAGRRSNRAGAAGPAGDPAAFVKALATIDPKKLMPTATLYVHVSREDLPPHGTGGSGVARVEGIGPVLTDQVGEWLRHRNVRVVPVLDLADVHSGVDSYEVPAWMREILRLRGPAGAYPWSSNLSRRKDADHTVPYAPQRAPAPPQTRVANLGLLDRPGHRIKTHGRGWKHRQPRPGVYLWRTPHGYWCRVDRTGTHLLGTTPSPYDLEGFAPDPRSAHERALADLIREQHRPD